LVRHSWLMFWTVSSSTYRLAPSTLIISCPYISPPVHVAFPKTLVFGPLLCIMCAAGPSVRSSFPFPWIICMQMTLNSSSTFSRPTSTQVWLIYKMLFNRCVPGWLQTNTSEAEFLLIGLKINLPKYIGPTFSFTITHCARNLGFIFGKHLTFSSLSKLCHILKSTLCIFAHMTWGHAAWTLENKAISSRGWCQGQLLWRGCQNREKDA